MAIAQDSHQTTTHYSKLNQIESKKAEVDKLQKSVLETLEHVSGLSAEEAKEKLIEAEHIFAEKRKKEMKEDFAFA